jgi:hypothetical protein
MKRTFLAFSIIYNALNRPLCNLGIYSTICGGEYLQKHAGLVETNINHHTSEWFLNKPNG